MAGAAAAELVDIVDARDQLIGRATRAEIRAGRLRHRATYLLVFNGRDELFVHERTATKDVYPSYWDVAVGGVVGAGESYEVGAARELAEEVGITAVGPQRLFDFEYVDTANQVNGRVYRVVWDGPLTLQAAEIVRGEWVSAAALEPRLATQAFCPDGVLAWRRYCDLPRR